MKSLQPLLASLVVLAWRQVLALLEQLGLGQVRQLLHLS
jgi:hypothetical protein